MVEGRGSEATVGSKFGAGHRAQSKRASFFQQTPSREQGKVRKGEAKGTNKKNRMRPGKFARELSRLVLTLEPPTCVHLRRSLYRLFSEKTVVHEILKY